MSFLIGIEACRADNDGRKRCDPGCIVEFGLRLRWNCIALLPFEQLRLIELRLGNSTQNTLQSAS